MDLDGESKLFYSRSDQRMCVQAGLLGFSQVLGCHFVGSIGFLCDHGFVCGSSR